jgi:hypothetical protein
MDSNLNFSPYYPLLASTASKPVSGQKVGKLPEYNLVLLILIEEGKNTIS